MNSNNNNTNQQSNYGSTIITNDVNNNNSEEENDNTSEVEETIPHVAKIVIMYTSSNLLALALYWQSVFVPLAYELFGESNLIVGLLACCFGMFQLLAAFTSGYFTDKNQMLRPRVLFIASVVGLVGISIFAIAVSFDWVKYSDFTRTWQDRRKDTLPMWLAGSSMIGFYQGLASANVEATIAAVIPQGKRDKIYATKAIFEALSGIAGCICALILFLSSGNKWSVRAMSIVVLFGLAIHLGVLLILVYLSNITAVWMKEHHERILEEEEKRQKEKEKLEKLALEARRREQAESGEIDHCCSSVFTGPLQVAPKFLPFFVSAGDMAVVLGSGCSIRFLMLFLIKDYGCSPKKRT